MQKLAFAKYNFPKGLKKEEDSFAKVFRFYVCFSLTLKSLAFPDTCHVYEHNVCFTPIYVYYWLNILDINRHLRMNFP